MDRHGAEVRESDGRNGSSNASKPAREPDGFTAGLLCFVGCSLPSRQLKRPAASGLWFIRQSVGEHLKKIVLCFAIAKAPDHHGGGDFTFTYGPGMNHRESVIRQQHFHTQRQVQIIF